jgi:hypothetical protein
VIRNQPICGANVTDSTSALSYFQRCYGFELGMGNVVQFRRAVASFKVIESLVKLGYLRPGNRDRASAIEGAIERLGQDLYRDGVIREGNLSCITLEDDQQQEAASFSGSAQSPT